jgi:hypothetical protein
MAKYGLTFNADYVLSLLKPVVARCFTVRRTVGGVTSDYPVPFVIGGEAVGDPVTGIAFTWENNLGFDVLLAAFAVNTTQVVDDNTPAVVLNVGVETDPAAPTHDDIISAFGIGMISQEVSDWYYILVPAGRYVVGWTPGNLGGWEGNWGSLAFRIPS